jgi:hypothetical protein
LANAPLSGSQDDAVAREIDWILEQLRWLDHAASTTATRSPRHEWLLRRRDELHEQLGVAEPKGEGNNPLADEASQWLVRLSAGRLRRVDWNHEDFTTDPQQMALAARGGLARIDGNPESGCPAADRALAALAVRLAAADLLARSGRSIPLVIEAQRELLRPLPAGEGELPAKPQAGDVAFPPASVSGELSLAVIAALDDYSQPSRQVIVLASDAAFADQAARRGGRVFHIHGERITHPHRPLWKPHYDRESYVGPYGTTPPAPSQQAPAGETDLWSRSDVLVDRYHDQYFDQMPVGASLAEINRNLDQIWQEAYGVAPETAGSPAAATTKSAHARGDLPGAPGVAPGVAPGASPVAGDWPELGPMPFADDFARPGGLPGTGGLAQAGRGPGMNPLPPVHPDATGGPVEAATAHWHDGYFFADTYTTAPRHSASPHRSAHPRGSATGRRGAAGAAEHAEPSDAGWDDASSPPGRRRVSSPFFLTVDSPIDQAPSVDAVAASRLRRLDVSHINHLMTQDPNRLADALGLANVTAATIRRWQAECRLVCHVPQLRGFDARILVGCGIRDAEQLAGTNPNDLLDRVEAFLATERGQQILLSGTSYELSRITSWIAAANMDTEQLPLAGTPDQQTIDGRVLQGQERGGRVAVASQPASEFQFVDDHGQVVRVRSTRSRRGRPAASGEMAGGQADDRGPARAHRSRAGKPSGRGGNAHTRRRAVESRPSSPRRSRNETTGAQAGATPRRTQRSRLDSADGNAETEANHASNTARRDRSEDHGEADLRFYLHRDSAVVDAPSIGARMAERLRAVGVVTVDDLLSSDPDELAEQLDHRRIDAAVIAGWQHQAILVCRIPMLRGHDAQLLVAAEITTPEEVAEYEAEDLLALVDPIARSNEGKRILRGGKRPDLDEVREWIHYARQHRELVAA